MTQITYKVEAFWDAEAEVWVATSEDIPGLVTETSTIDILTEKLRVMIPELLVFFVGWVERSETQHHPPGYDNMIINVGLRFTL
ncbi:MAG: DUF1902 domain-containing protein [Dolichospermum sp. DEX182a]|nr:DUF1902 domain-containing protein [Dolichospermum sp. DEX182a]